MPFKGMILHKKRHGLLTYLDKVAWAIKLPLQIWEFMDEHSLCNSEDSCYRSRI